MKIGNVLSLDCTLDVRLPSCTDCGGAKGHLGGGGKGHLLWPWGRREGKKSHVKSWKKKLMNNYISYRIFHEEVRLHMHGAGTHMWTKKAFFSKAINHLVEDELSEDCRSLSASICILVSSKLKRPPFFVPTKWAGSAIRRGRQERM